MLMPVPRALRSRRRERGELALARRGRAAARAHRTRFRWSQRQLLAPPPSHQPDAPAEQQQRQRHRQQERHRGSRSARRGWLMTGSVIRLAIVPLPHRHPLLQPSAEAPPHVGWDGGSDRGAQQNAAPRRSIEPFVKSISRRRCRKKSSPRSPSRHEHRAHNTMATSSGTWPTKRTANRVGRSFTACR